jgi:hypothetical protein
LSFGSVGFLFELPSTGATVWQTDRPPFATSLRLGKSERNPVDLKLAGRQSDRRAVAPVDGCSNGKPVEFCSGKNPAGLTFQSTVSLFEHRSTDATVWQTDHLPDAAAPRLGRYKLVAGISELVAGML